MPDQSSVAEAQESALLEPPLGRLCEVAGRRLLLHRSGSGGPAVVFLPGAGLVGLDYLNMHNRVAELTTTVLYDRAGTGWSEAAALPRTAAAVTDELMDLLRAADVPGPYLLVGHSLGAAYGPPHRTTLPRRGGRPAPAGPVPRRPPRTRAPRSSGQAEGYGEPGAARAHRGAATACPQPNGTLVRQLARSCP
ncbi:alpha/beta fold hydrolase [Streptomyces sp. NBC_00846]|uniref:alpha/beta fold hydrolase n=1 Tax=Streptomyces sp. NBC_00846 TaxID=2975849 RepID=UPI00386AF342